MPNLNKNMLGLLDIPLVSMLKKWMRKRKKEDYEGDGKK